LNAKFREKLLNLGGLKQSIIASFDLIFDFDEKNIAHHL
jgi:hypothetical protein